MDLLKIKSYVHGLLLRGTRSRESDNVLMANIWGHQLKERLNSGMTARELLQELADGKLANWESATRCRRKLQELYPSLRGHNYKIRKLEAEKVKQQIKNFNHYTAA